MSLIKGGEFMMELAMSSGHLEENFQDIVLELVLFLWTFMK